MTDERVVRDDEGNPVAHVVWTDRTEQIMHDVGEALGVNTDLIMAVHEKGERKLSAFYTPRYPDDETVWLALLRRNRDGTLRVVSRERRPGMLDDMRAELERRFAQ